MDFSFFLHTKTFTPIILSSSHVHYFWVVLIGDGDFVGGTGVQDSKKTHKSSEKTKNPEKVCRKNFDFFYVILSIIFIAVMSRERRKKIRIIIIWFNLIG